MKLITSTDIKHWADKIESKNMLPLLIRKLVLSGVKIDELSLLEFPFGEDVQTGGYDGELEVENGNLYIPSGNSVWEFGTTEKKKGKADEDYEKRKKNTLGKNPLETTYLNVTAKKWNAKDKWKDAKIAEGFWLDVKSYDATTIEHWLELAPSVEVWFARLLGKPVNGTYSIDEYWEDWSTYKNLKMPFELLLGNRKEESKNLIEQLTTKGATSIAVKSNTKEEALAFILSSLSTTDELIKEKLQSSTLIVDNLQSFRELIESDIPLNLIALFEEETIDLNRALRKGHTIILPVSSSFLGSADKSIDLPSIDRDTFVDVLSEMGIDKEKARLLSKNTARNISVLRRTLGYLSKTPAWISLKSPSELVPILVLARFNQASDGDKEIVSNFSGLDFEEYEKVLLEILNHHETPLYKIGSSWRLISHTDAWVQLARFVTDDDITKFKNVVLEVLGEYDPKYDLEPAERHMASFRNAKPKYSYELKRGLCETLIILSLFGKEYGIATTINPKSVVDNLVRELLSNADEKLLRSLRHNMMLIAEASPNIFLEQIETIIDDGRINGFFEIQDGILNSSNDLPYLLWSLEEIAWMPENLTQVSRIICKIINKSPAKLPISNTPFNTLKNIYRAWFPQTNASAEERKQVLEILTREYPDIAFSLFSSLVKNRFDTAFPTHKMRWRLYQETRSVKVTNREVWHIYNFLVTQMIKLMGNSSDRAMVLIEKIDDVSWEKVDEILAAIETITCENDIEKGKVYHAFRELIGRHRTHAKQDWSLPEEILAKAEIVGVKFEPSDISIKNKFLFDDHRPEFYKGYDKSVNHRDIEAIILKERSDFLATLKAEKGIESIIELAQNSKNTYMVGQALAHVKLSENEEDKILLLLMSEDATIVTFASYYVSSLDRIVGREKCLEKFEKLLASEKFNVTGLGNYLLSLWDNIELWKYVDSLDKEIEHYYWYNHRASMSHDSDEIQFAMNKFITKNRSITALNSLKYLVYAKDFPVDFVIETLEKINLSSFDEPNNNRLDSYGIAHAFEELHKMDTLDIEKMGMLEYKYNFCFDKYGSGTLPMFLFKLIATRPDLYMELVRNTYLPKSDEGKEKEEQEKEKASVSPELKKQLFESSFNLLRNFNLIPGLNEDGTIDSETLESWINSVRTLAIEFDRTEVTDISIGELLAKYPKQDDIWFPDIICDIIEKHNTKDLKSGFSMGIFNGQGVTSRAAGSGGYIERDRAEIFNKIYEHRKITHPSVAKVFQSLSSEYLRDAERMDESALRENLES